MPNSEHATPGGGPDWPGDAFDAPEPTVQQRRSVLRWQKTDRYYAQVQNAARSDDRPTSPEVAEVIDDLTQVIESSELTRPVETWRGDRSSIAAFGVPSDRLEELVGTEREVNGFAAMSGSRGVAEDEFTVPAGEGGPVLSRFSVPAGTRAAWIAGMGDPEMAYQQELLMDSPVVRFVEVDRTGPLPMLIIEVVE